MWFNIYEYGNRINRTEYSLGVIREAVTNVIGFFFLNWKCLYFCLYVFCVTLKNMTKIKYRQYISIIIINSLIAINWSIQIKVV